MIRMIDNLWGVTIHPVENNKMRGNVTILLKDRNGKVIERHNVKNLIVSSGKRFIANLFRGEENQPVTHMAVGTGSTIPSSADTGLEEELPTRRPFDQNLLTEESGAYLVLVDIAKKDVLKIASKLCGEKGNFTSIEVKSSGVDRFSLCISGETDEDFLEEEFPDLSIDAKDKRYVEKIVNNESQLVVAKRIVRSVPVNKPRISLDNGRDAVVTLGATFGYEDCNGPITEAGIFNAESEGTMYNRVVFSEINKTDKLTLSLIWKVSF